MRGYVYLLLTCSLAACSDGFEDNAMTVDNLAVEDMAVEQPTIFCEAVRERVTEAECADLTALKEDVRTGAAALDVPNPMTRGRASEVTLVLDRRPLQEIREAERIDDLAVDPEGDNQNATDAVSNASDVPADDTATHANGASPDDALTNEDLVDEPVAETPNQIAAQLPGEDHPFYSRVGRYMKATLVGQGFEIKPIEPQDGILEIPAGGQGTWIWEVTPRREGRHTLTALTQAVGEVNGRVIPLGNGRTSKTIAIEVRPIDRLWDMLVAAPLWLQALAGVLTALATVLGAWLVLRKQWRDRNK